MRKPDHRGRRMRNTLSVDLGVNGLPLLDACEDLLKARLSMYKNPRRRKLTRGVVIRVALRCLRICASDSVNPIKDAIKEELWEQDVRRKQM